MAGAAVPAAGAIGLDTVTNAAQETNLENLAEAARRMLGVGVTATATSVISAGVIAPTLGFVLVDTEGAAPTDNLDNISPTAYLEGSIVLLVSASGGTRVVTCRNAQGGSGQFVLTNASNFALTNGFSWILLRQVAGLWIEIDRSYGTDFASLRSFIGLGSVATLNNGAVNAATLQGNAASAFLLTGGTAANSTLFSGLAASAFLRADIASLQTIAGSLRAASGRLESAIASSAGTAMASLLAGGVERTQLFFDGVSGHTTLRLLSALGAVQAGIRFRPSTIPDYWDGAAWVPLFTVTSPSPWLNRVRWNKLDGTAVISGSGRTIIHSADAPVLPGSGATRIYRVSAAIRGARRSSNARFTARLYAGPAGNDLDTLIYETAELLLASPGDEIQDAVIDRELEIPASAKLTLVLQKNDSNSMDVRPSVASTYYVDEFTYLRAEQVG